MKHQESVWNTNTVIIGILLLWKVIILSICTSTPGVDHHWTPIDCCMIQCWFHFICVPWVRKKRNRGSGTYKTDFHNMLAVNAHMLRWYNYPCEYFCGFTQSSLALVSDSWVTNSLIMLQSVVRQRLRGSSGTRYMSGRLFCVSDNPFALVH